MRSRREQPTRAADVRMERMSISNSFLSFSRSGAMVGSGVRWLCVRFVGTFLDDLFEGA